MLWEKLLGQIVHKTSEKNTEMWVENDVIKQICTAYYLEMKVIWNKNLKAVNMWFIKKKISYVVAKIIVFYIIKTYFMKIEHNIWETQYIVEICKISAFDSRKPNQS